MVWQEFLRDACPQLRTYDSLVEQARTFRPGWHEAQAEMARLMHRALERVFDRFCAGQHIGCATYRELALDNARSRPAMAMQDHARHLERGDVPADVRKYIKDGIYLIIGLFLWEVGNKIEHGARIQRRLGEARVRLAVGRLVDRFEADKAAGVRELHAHLAAASSVARTSFEGIVYTIGVHYALGLYPHLCAVHGLRWDTPPMRDRFNMLGHRVPSILWQEDMPRSERPHGSGG